MPDLNRLDEVDDGIRPMPEGYRAVAPWIISRDTAGLLDAREGWLDTLGFFRLYVEDGDAVYRRALEAGCVSVTEMTRLFFGDRVGRVRDPQGNVWWIQSRVEDIDAEEMEKRAGEKGYVNAMRYVQESLDCELGGRSRRQDRTRPMSNHTERRPDHDRR